MKGIYGKVAFPVKIGIQKGTVWDLGAEPPQKSFCEFPPREGGMFYEMDIMCMFSHNVIG